MSESLLRNRGRDAVFLCYHSVHDDGPRWLSVGPAAFERQLDALRRHGWRSGTEADLEAIAASAPAGGRAAFLTFDDGYVDNFTTAFPLLRERGMTGIFFLLPAHVDRGGAFEWPEVAEDQRRRPRVGDGVTRLGQLDLFHTVGGEDGHPASVQRSHVSSSRRRCGYPVRAGLNGRVAAVTGRRA